MAIPNELRCMCSNFEENNKESPFKDKCETITEFQSDNL